MKCSFLKSLCFLFNVGIQIFPYKPYRENRFKSFKRTFHIASLKKQRYN